MPLKITVEGTSTNAYAALTIKRLIQRAFPEKRVEFGIVRPGAPRDERIDQQVERQIELEHASYSDETVPSISLGDHIQITSIEANLLGEKPPVMVSVGAISMIMLLKPHIQKKLYQRGLSINEATVLLDQIVEPGYELHPVLHTVVKELMADTDFHFNNLRNKEPHPSKESQ